MQFLKIFVVVFATMATAYEASFEGNGESNMVRIHLPKGCSKSKLASCVLNLGMKSDSCDTALAAMGADPVADLSCIGSVADTAAKIPACKGCIPKNFLVEEV
ncbi:hypothetical protein E4U42_007135 [Claviceps africana]|uniref:Fungal calcium binding protein domain-containing protein n=1 Tax=Claviceps africana TaxID=83212 RepID=A0A8K0NKX7_9HYPO|nr:hypothetical protein E4U42_007135 [Claviceps africana]